MFSGLSAFPITPFKNDKIDVAAFEVLINNLVSADVNSICAMGSTGLYPYLNNQEFTVIAKTSVECAEGIPVMAGIGALRTSEVLKKAEIAQHAGANALLLAPVSYHPLTEQEVFSLYQTVCAEISVPLCVYENPGVTNFTFSDQLYEAIAQLPNIGAIKIPGMPFVTEQGNARLATLRSLLPETVAIGVSGDKFGAAGMAAGCDLWLSVLGGLFPNTVNQLIKKPKQSTQGDQLEPLFELFTRGKGGMRVMAAAASILGYTETNCLPAPLQPLPQADRETLEKLLLRLQLS